MKTIRHALRVARKDLALELRTKESINAAGAFAISILLLFSFAFNPDSDMLHEISGGLLWLVFVFAGALIFNRGFARELPNDCLDALLSSALSGASLLLGKAFANLVVSDLARNRVADRLRDLLQRHLDANIPAELAVILVLARGACRSSARYLGH